MEGDIGIFNRVREGTLQVHNFISLAPKEEKEGAFGGYSVCVCVFFPFILDIKFVGRTSRGHTGGRSHRISHPPSFCGACLNFSRENDSAIIFPRRP